MHKADKAVYLRRWQQAIRRIGHARLLYLPSFYKKRLHETTDLVGKVLLLEEIVRIYKV